MANTACASGCSPPPAVSAATDAPEQSGSTSSTCGAALSSRSKRPRSAAGDRGDDAALQHAWTILGLPDWYDAPGEQEINDLADPRSRKRGEREQKRRLKANWQLYERQAQHADAAKPEVAAGPALPAYLLERDEAARLAPADAPTYVDVVALRARLQPSSAAQRDGEGAEADDAWLAGHLARMGRRERRFLAWHDAHGAEREEQLAQLQMGVPFYWARAHPPEQRPRWLLRQAEQLGADSMRTLDKNALGVEEPLLLYRAFSPFTGDVLKAQEFFAQRGDIEAQLAATAWLDGERA